MNRRSFLSVLGLGAVAAPGLSACIGTSAAMPAAPVNTIGQAHREAFDAGTFSSFPGITDPCHTHVQTSIYSNHARYVHGRVVSRPDENGHVWVKFHGAIHG